MIYVSSDWHGVPLERINALLDLAGFCDDDYLFVLGDVIDRGDSSVELLKFLMSAPNIELIRGNHEAMMLSCKFLFDRITDESAEALDAKSLKLLSNWQLNGADPTIKALSRESAETRTEIIEFLTDTPLDDSVSVNGHDFLLVHGGLGNYDDGIPISEISKSDLLWSRPSPDTRYSVDFTTVIGHTPTDFYGKRYKGKILKTETWIDVDTGAAHGGNPCLLRLDDMKEYYL